MDDERERWNAEARKMRDKARGGNFANAFYKTPWRAYSVYVHKRLETRNRVYAIGNENEKRDAYTAGYAHVYVCVCGYTRTYMYI